MSGRPPGAFAVRYADRPTYEPPRHGGVVNRSLAGIDVHELDRISVWHGTMAPHGHAEPHVHEGSDQIYVVLNGQVEVGCGDEVAQLNALDSAYIAAGTRHWIANHEPTPAHVLVISAPSLPGARALQTEPGQ